MNKHLFALSVVAAALVGSPSVHATDSVTPFTVMVTYTQACYLSAASTTTEATLNVDSTGAYSGTPISFDLHCTGYTPAVGIRPQGGSATGSTFISNSASEFNGAVYNVTLKNTGTTYTVTPSVESGNQSSWSSATCSGGGYTCTATHHYEIVATF